MVNPPIELLETVIRSSSDIQILEQYCLGRLSQAFYEENLHDIGKLFHHMVQNWWIFHGMQRKLNIMDAGKEPFHDV